MKNGIYYCKLQTLQRTSQYIFLKKNKMQLKFDRLCNISKTLIHKDEQSKGLLFTVLLKKV